MATCSTNAPPFPNYWVKTLMFHKYAEIVTLQMLRNCILINYSKFRKNGTFSIKSDPIYFLSLWDTTNSFRKNWFCYCSETPCPSIRNPFKLTSKFLHSLWCLGDSSVFAWGKTFRKWLSIKEDTTKHLSIRECLKTDISIHPSRNQIHIVILVCLYFSHLVLY